MRMRRVWRCILMDGSGERGLCWEENEKYGRNAGSGENR